MVKVFQKIITKLSKKDKNKCNHDYVFSNKLLGVKDDKVVGICRKCKETISLTYCEYAELLKELKGNGETNSE